MCPSKLFSHDRTRAIEVHKQWGGKDCDGPVLEEEDCEIVPC